MMYMYSVLLALCVVSVKATFIKDGIVTIPHTILAQAASWFENFPEDARLNFTELAFKYGLQCEEHSVVTDDGYVLTMFHIPGDPGRPALLVHGFIASSDAFIMRGNISLAVTLSAAGYDVWALNFRGNFYSRKHISLDPNTDADYWNFSYHEFGLYDLPASIDYALQQTGRENLVIFSFSQGCAAALVMGSLLPEYNEKVELLVALAPITNLAHAKGLANNIFYLFPFVHTFYEEIGLKEVLRKGTLMNTLINIICSNFKHFCYKFYVEKLWLRLIGVSEVDVDFYLVTRGHYPAGTSKKNAEHVMQNWYTSRFAQYDYGTATNLEIYNDIQPPLYNLCKVTMKVAIFYTKNDDLCTKSDIEVLENSLPNVVHSYMIQKDTVRHVDFVWGRNIDQFLYPHMFDALMKFTE